MDVGIIESFKENYNKMLIKHRIDSYMLSKDPEIDIYQAIIWVVQAWRKQVTSTTIVNCWRHTGTISVHLENGELAVTMQKELDDITQFLQKLSLVSIKTIGVACIVVSEKSLNPLLVVGSSKIERWQLTNHI
jgi:hypothetical protein